MTLVRHYMTGNLAAGSNHLALDDAAPAAATSSTGWTCGTTAAFRYAAMDSQTKRAATALTTTNPSGNPPDNALGDCFRTPAPISGIVSANNSPRWSIQLISARSSDTLDVTITFGFWASADPTGAGAHPMATYSTTPQFVNLNNATTQVQSLFASSVIYPDQAITNEYLFWKIVLTNPGAGNNSASEAVIRVGASSYVEYDLAPPAVTSRLAMVV